MPDTAFARQLHTLASRYGPRIDAARARQQHARAERLAAAYDVKVARLVTRHAPRDHAPA